MQRVLIVKMQLSGVEAFVLRQRPSEKAWTFSGGMNLESWFHGLSNSVGPVSLALAHVFRQPAIERTESFATTQQDFRAASIRTSFWTFG
jgi:hypothetical protein